MSDPILPRYPVYIPSKGRADVCFTARVLEADHVPFWLVVEPQEAAQYAAHFGAERLLLLPWSGASAARAAYCQERGIEDGGLVAARNWIKEHATAAGAARHWQLDDNIASIMRRYQAQRLHCAAGPALAATEDFVDRYENISIAGLNYKSFIPEHKRWPPFYLNCRVYSCSLILNSMPQRWRIAYNDDTDICLQVLAAGQCTLLMNAFLINKIATMVVKGGNTKELYQGDGRLKMSRSLERLWPGIVTTIRRWERPQHKVKNSWRMFDTPLRLRADIDPAALEAPNEYGMRLEQRKEIRSAELRRMLEEQQ